MKCLWPRIGAQFGHAMLAAILLASSFSTAIYSSSEYGTGRKHDSENLLRRVPEHKSEFSLVNRSAPLPKCGDVRPPEALLTPDPLLRVEDDNFNIRISFIVGSDGKVHSALILDSGGPADDQIVLRAVRYWRYRPALCNGVPADSEALVRFTVH